MEIANVIRKLRRERDITQEKLASVLGVSFQTVSKWERGEAMPDITLLPMLAAFFGTTTDVLLGTDEERKKQRSTELSIRLNELRSSGTRDMEIEFLRDFAAENPDSIGALKILAFMISEKADELADETEAEKLNREALAIYERILEFDLPDDMYGLKGDLKLYIIEMLWKLGEFERGDKLAEEFRYPLAVVDLGATKMKYLRGKNRVVHAACRILDTFETFLDAVNCMVDFDDEYECGNSDEEKLDLLKLAYSMVPIIFDDGKYEWKSGDVATLCIQIAELYSKTGDTTKAFDMLERAADCAIRFDGLQRVDIRDPMFSGSIIVSRYTSTFLKYVSLMGGRMPRLYKDPTVSGELLYKHLSRPAFEAMRDDTRFAEIEQRLKDRADKGEIVTHYKDEHGNWIAFS